MSEAHDPQTHSGRGGRARCMARDAVRQTLASLIVLIAAPLFTENSFAQYSTVAWRGAQAPGTGGTFYLRLGFPSINAVCDAGFNADLNTSLPADQGAWLGKPPTIDLIALKNDLAPGTGGATFRHLDLPLLTPSSEFLIPGALTTGTGVDATNNSGLWTGTVAALQLLARTGDPAPDTGVGQVYELIGRRSTNAPDTGGLNAVFFAELTGTGVTSTNDNGIWAGAPGDVRLVAREGLPAPGMPGYNLEVLLVSQDHPSINQNGVVGFWGRAIELSTGEPLFVAWVGPRSNPQPILRSGDVTADMPAGYAMTEVSLHSINNAGDAAGRGVIAPAIGFGNLVVWRSSGGVVEFALIEGEQVPGLPAGVVWGPGGNGYNPAINANGVVASTARLAGTGVTTSNDSAIFMGVPGSMAIVAREGDPAPGLGADVYFGDLPSRNLVLNAIDQVAFPVPLTGAGVTPANNYALFYGSPGALVPVVRKGDSIEVVPGLFRTVAAIPLANEGNTGNQDGKYSYLNDDGVVAFNVLFTDGNNAVLTWPGAGCLPPANRAPEITSVPPTTGTVGVNYIYDVDATDPDGDALTYAKDSGPVGMFIDPVTGLLQWTVLAGQEGTNTVTVSVRDPDGLSDTQTFDVIVPFPNRPPTITSTPPTNGTVGIPYSYDVDATDPDGDAVTYSLTIRPTGMTIDPTTGLIQWTPTSGDLGFKTVRVRATDPGGLYGEQTYSLTVVADNQPPIITTTPSLAGTEGSPYSYDVDATDPDGDLLSYSLDVAPAGMSIGPATGLVQWTPTGAQLGANAVTVRVEDSNGGFATQSFSIDVAAANQPPTITSTPTLGGTEGISYTYDVDATDPDGDFLAYSIDEAPAGMTIDPLSGLIEWTPDTAQLGANAVTVRVEDGNGGFATQSFSIYVAAANQLPVADTGGPYSGTVGIPLSFNGNDSMDPDGFLISYEWNFGDGNTASGPAPSHTYLSDGTFVVELTVTDDWGATDTAATTAVINMINIAPVADPGGPYSGTAGVELAMDGGNSTDPDGTIVSYEWEFGDGNVGFGVAPAHTYLAADTYNVTLQVTDDDGAVRSAMTTAVVLDTPANTAPVCSDAFPSIDYIWPPNHRFVPVSVGGVTDADGDPISITIDSIFQDEPVNALGDGDTARDGRGVGTDLAEIRAERSGTKTVPGNGRVYHIAFTASDGRGATCSGSVAVSVPHDENSDSIDDGALYDSTSR